MQDRQEDDEIELVSNSNSLLQLQPSSLVEDDEDFETKEETSRLFSNSTTIGANDVLKRISNGNMNKQQGWHDDLFPPHHLCTPVVSCILLMETAERFAYFGFRAVLVLYFTECLYLDESTAISYFSYTACVAYFSPLLGALLAERWGRFAVILRFGILYGVGLFILTVAAWLGQQQDDPYRSHGVEESLRDMFWKRILTVVGLVMVATGTGGLKPCVNIFGADQVASLRTSDTDDTPQQGTTTHRIMEGNQTEPQPQDDDHAVREFYNFFYFCINVGATTSYLTIPIVKHYFGFGAAFLLPTLFMVFAISLFYSKRKEYVYRDEDSQKHHSLATTFSILLQLLRQRMSVWLETLVTTTVRTTTATSSWRIDARGPRHELLRQQDDDEEDDYAQTRQSDPTETAAAETSPNDDSSSASRDVFQDEEPDNASSQKNPSSSTASNKHQSSSWARHEMALEDAHQALQILPIMAMLPMFWMLYDQQGSVWTLQASRMALHGLEPEQLQMLNPIEIMIFIPLFDRIIYPFLEDRLHWNISPLIRMGWGMVLAAVSFLVSGLLEHVIEFSSSGSQSVHVLWQVPQITIMAVGEIFLSVTGLEYAYSRSPDRLKGFIMATYLLTTAVGDLLGGILYSSVFKDMNRAVVMYVCAVLMLLNRFAFGRVVKATTSTSTQQQQQLDETTTNTAEPDNTPAMISRHSSEGSMVMVEGEKVSNAGNGERSLNDNDDNASPLEDVVVEEYWMSLELPKMQIV
ncbi:Peptide transporter family 1 [Seminavis robusta]|uniref:Peptide transporter family 1 n=1 Tax=Seminavis robusta TaxID=568900 RepID=A0A9N8EAH1_9STRA|nr:Peptide transporter family 1 [Seminavis robusta]|eukprot:Sro727_g193560.1 Peptide transporter family 1 (749) ;mRNA; f:5736-8118